VRTALEKQFGKRISATEEFSKIIHGFLRFFQRVRYETGNGRQVMKWTDEPSFGVAMIILRIFAAEDRQRNLDGKGF